MATPGNLAITWMYGWFKYTNFMLPYYGDVWSGICKSFNVTVDVHNGNASTPGGVGNLAGTDLRYPSLGHLTPPPQHSVPLMGDPLQPLAFSGREEASPWQSGPALFL